MPDAAPAPRGGARVMATIAEATRRARPITSRRFRSSTRCAQQRRLLRVLVLSEDPAEAAQLAAEIAQEGHLVLHQRVADLRALRAALDAATRPWDLVIADVRAAALGAVEALATLRRDRREVRFLVVS